MSGLLRAVEQAMWRTFAATITTGAVVFLIGSVVALFTCGAAAATGNLRGMAAAAMHDLCPTCAAPALTRYTPPTQHKKGA